MRIERYVRPAPAAQMFQGVVTPGYGTPSKDLWLGTTGVSADIPHYSFKFYIRNWFAAAVNSGMGFRLSPTLYFRVRGTH